MFPVKITGNRLAILKKLSALFRVSKKFIIRISFSKLTPLSQTFQKSGDRIDKLDI